MNYSINLNILINLKINIYLYICICNYQNILLNTSAMLHVGLRAPYRPTGDICVICDAILEVASSWRCVRFLLFSSPK